MRTWTPIANIFALIMLLMVLPVVHNIDRTMERQFEEDKLRVALDYATEAAFMSTLEVEDIELDYTDMAKVRINPSKCLDVFKSLICFSYGMSRSEENFQYLERFIPTAMLVCNDGYYVAKMTEIDTNASDGIDGDEYALKWTLKLPFSLEANGKLYGVNIMDDSWCSVEETIIGGTMGVKYDQGNEAIPGVTKDMIRKVVSETITREITKGIIARNRVIEYSKEPYNFFIPSELTKTGVNPIVKPSLIIMLQGVDFASSVKVDAMSVGGVTTDRKRVVVGFIQDGYKYYCYERQLPEDIISLSKEFFNNVEQAAQAGYHPHYEYLGNRIRE